MFSSSLSLILFIFVGVAFVVILAYLVILYNSLVQVKNNVEKAFKNIDVLLKQRHEELPKLIDTCKGYMKHEWKILEKLTILREHYSAANSMDDKTKIENQINQQYLIHTVMKRRFTCFAMMIVLTFPFVCKSMEKDALSLPLTIAQEYIVTNTSKESLPGPIPDQNPTTQIFVEVTRSEKKAYIFYWDGHPHRDLGPMVEKESWQFKFLGGDVNVTRTSMFMGQEQEVLVVHHRPDEKTQLMIYSKDMNKDEFHEMLGKMRGK